MTLRLWRRIFPSRSNADTTVWMCGSERQPSRLFMQSGSQKGRQSAGGSVS